jgi:cytidine deaminase
MKTDELLQKARDVRENAYAPYSRFLVGAALVTEGGSVFVGANLENASYGLAICAERSAAAAAIAAGHRNFRAIAVAGPPNARTAPCGACRQFLNEFNPQLAVAYTVPGGIEETTLDKLLPDSFGPKSLDTSG